MPIILRKEVIKLENPVVFVINKSSHDYSQAEQFGSLVFMSEGSLNRYAVSKMFRIFKPFVKASKPQDYLLMSGLGIMQSIASSMFAVKHKQLNLLIYKPTKGSQGTYFERTLVF